MEIESKPKGETGAIEVPRRERVKRSPTTVRTRRLRSLVKTPDLRLTIKEYQGALKNIARLRPEPNITRINLLLLQYMYVLCTS